jgi:hypothetical protein
MSSLRIVLVVLVLIFLADTASSFTASSCGFHACRVALGPAARASFSRVRVQKSGYWIDMRVEGNHAGTDDCGVSRGAEDSEGGSVEKSGDRDMTGAVSERHAKLRPTEVTPELEMEQLLDVGMRFDG